MQGEIITIGNELTSGRVHDLNAWYAAGRLTASGLKVTRATTVGDEPHVVSEALKKAVQESQFVIVTGGLGSTEDDVTCEIAARALNRPLSLDPEMFEQIRTYVEARGMEMSSAYEKMAWMPKDSKLIDPKGNVCGFSLVQEKARIYFLPGVPDQMRYLMDAFVLPELLLNCRTISLHSHRILKLYGIDEPRIAETLKDLPKEREGVVLGFYPQFPENHITMSLRGQDEPAMTSELDRMEERLRARLGEFIFAAGNLTMESAVGEALSERGLTLSVAESCSGGLIGNLLTNIPGSSRSFLGGVIAYGNQAKMDLLGVSRESLTRHGAVSDPTVREMARGVREKMKTDLGVAVSGIAGPDGGSREKPVGTVFIALAARDALFSDRYRFWGTRGQIKLHTAMMALDWIRRYLHGHPFLPGIRTGA